MEDTRVGIAGVIENCVVLLSRLNDVEDWIPRILTRLNNSLSVGSAENGGVGVLRFQMGYGDEAEVELADWTKPQVKEGGTIFLMKSTFYMRNFVSLVSFM